MFPLAPGAKVPLAGSRGYLDATTDSAIIRRWWTREPNANVGAATGPTSGFWVLDIDRQHDGPATLARLLAEHEVLPATATARTPSGGVHLYFGWTGCPEELRCSTSRVGPGIDVRAIGGGITLPPSRLADSRHYRWENNGVGLATAPAWLVGLALPPPPRPRLPAKPLDRDVHRYIGAAAASELSTLARALPGTRNAALFRAAVSLAGFVLAGALPERWARDTLEKTAISIGLSEREARGTIGSAFRAARPRTIPA